MTANSTTRLREALAEREWRRACPNSTKDGWLYAKRAAERDPHSLTRYYDEADAILAALPEHRDDVLDVLGMEQVGRLCSRHGPGCHSRCSEPMEPVYAFRPKEQP